MIKYKIIKYKIIYNTTKKMKKTKKTKTIKKIMIKQRISP